MDKQGLKPFVLDDLRCWSPYHIEYFINVLNGEYKLEDARDDLRGLIGSKYDPRLEKL